MELSAEEKNHMIATLGLANAENTTTGATFSLTGAFKGLGVAIAANPIGLIITAFTLASTAIAAYNQKQQELIQDTKDSIDKMNDELSALDSLKEKYIEICDSEDNETTKTEKLNDWKQTLIDTYGFEREALEKLNLEREKGIELLDAEITMQKISEYNQWLGQNDAAYNKAKDYIEKDYRTERKYDGTIELDILSGIKKDDIRQEIQSEFDSVSESFFTVDGDNLIVVYNNMQKIIGALGAITDRTESEQKLLEALNRESGNIKKKLGNYQETYETGITAEAYRNLGNYIAVDGKAIQNVGKDTYQAWKQGLIDTAQGDKNLESELEKIAAQQFPSYDKYFSNLAELKNKYNLNDINGDIGSGKRLSFLLGLSDDDLQIATQIPDLFKDGIDNARQILDDFKNSPDSKITITATDTFDYTAYTDKIDSITKKTKKFQSALNSLEKSGKISDETLFELAGVFPEYSGKILAAKDNTDELKTALNEIVHAAPQSLISELQGLKGLSEQDQQAVNTLISALNSMGVEVNNTADMLDDLSNKQSILSATYKEMNTDGHISAGTYKKLLEAGIDYSNCIDDTNGILTVNVTKMKALTDEYFKNAIEAKNAAIAAEQYNLSMAPVRGEDIQKYEQRIQQLKQDRDLLQSEWELFDGYDYTADGSSKDKNKEAFEKEYNKWKHSREMNEISESDFYDWLDGADGFKKYFSDLIKYQDEYNKYEEEIYKYRKSREQDLYEQKVNNYKALAKQALDGDITNFVDEKDVKALEDYNKEMQATYGLGNVDLTKRPKVDMPDGSTATVLTETEFVWQGDEENGKYVAVHYTPILPDGTVLDKKPLNNYLTKTIEGSEDVLKADSLGIVLKVDTDFDISEDDIKSLETDKYTDNIRNIINACEEWDNSLHKAQETWVELDNKVNNSDVNKFDYAREQINSAIAETQNRIDQLTNSGIKGNEKEIESLKKSLKDLYGQLKEIDEKEIKSEKDYVTDLKKKYDAEIDAKIKAVDDYSDAVSKAYDKQIKAIDKQIDALEKVEKQEQRIENIMEAQKAVKEAEQDLEKARVKSRLVYAGHGQWEMREDKEKVKQAQDNLDKAKKGLDKAEKAEQKAQLEDQKSTLEEQKNDAKEYYDNITDEWKEQKADREKTYDILIDILDSIGDDDKQTSFNDKLYGKLTADGNINEAVKRLTVGELKHALSSGLLSVDGNGNYTVNKSALSKDSDTTKTALKDIDSSLKDLMPKGADKSENAAAVKENQGKHIIPLKDMAGIKLNNPDTIQFLQNLSAGAMGDNKPNIKSTYPTLTSEAPVTNNSSTTNNAPVVNLNVTIEGSADEKTVQRFKDVASTEIIKAFNGFTNAYINAK